MPRKRIIPQEDLEQTAAEAVEQSGMEETAVPPDSPFQEMDTSGNGPPLETGEAGGILLAPEDSPGLSGESDEDAPEVMALDVPEFPFPPEDSPPVEMPVEAQESGSSGDAPMEDAPPVGEAAPAWTEGVPPRNSMPDGDMPPAPPMNDRQSFFALDFRELDRGLSPEERQAWNSILCVLPWPQRPVRKDCRRGRPFHECAQQADRTGGTAHHVLRDGAGLPRARLHPRQ